ncbi:glycosyltransferase family A protein [Actinomadura sp. B10D3]|uniref:glycosyltransferase family 2 protein n=1 Tax=Actinomadura sp. B10D3 TaxID=3153557 RepID=UPI00325E48C6
MPTAAPTSVPVWEPVTDPSSSPQDDDTGVTVLTVTRGRPDLLQERCMASVRKQTVRVRHLVIVDGCPATRAALPESPPGTEVLYSPRSASDHSGPGRLARLRNLAVARATTDRIAFLDDDNEWEPEHIESLLSLARATGSPAVHSERIVLHPDGSPWLDGTWPWSRDPAESRRKYAFALACGVVTPGTPYMRDRADPHRRTGAWRDVDTNTWLFERDLLLAHPFLEEYTPQHETDFMGEDSVLLEELLDAGVAIACTKRPTLRYYLGGFSNCGGKGREDGFAWR